MCVPPVILRPGLVLWSCLPPEILKPRLVLWSCLDVNGHLWNKLYHLPGDPITGKIRKAEAALPGATFKEVVGSVSAESMGVVTYITSCNCLAVASESRPLLSGAVQRLQSFLLTAPFTSSPGIVWRQPLGELKCHFNQKTPSSLCFGDGQFLCWTAKEHEVWRGPPQLHRGFPPLQYPGAQAHLLPAVFRGWAAVVLFRR